MHKLFGREEAVKAWTDVLLQIAPVEKGAAEAEVGMGMGTFKGGGGGGGGSRSDESEKAGAFPEL